MLMRMMRVRRMVKLLMDCLCKSWTARLTPFVFAAFLGLKVGEEAEHLYLDLAEFGLREGDNNEDGGGEDEGNVICRSQRVKVKCLLPGGQLC